MSSVPETPLLDRRWRLRHSLWILPTVLGFALLTWTSFLYVGLVARRRDWLLAAAGYAAAAAFLLVTGEEDTGLTAFAGFATWGGGAVHALVVNRTWLRWRAEQPEWYETVGGAAPAASRRGPARPGPRPVTSGTGAAATGGGGLLGMGDPSAAYYAEDQGAPAEAAVPVEVNTATHLELAALPGVDRRLARRITVERRRRGGFADLAELASAVDLPPHLVVRLRPLLRFDPPPRSGRGPRPPRGRVLDV